MNLQRISFLIMLLAFVSVCSCKKQKKLKGNYLLNKLKNSNSVKQSSSDGSSSEEEILPEPIKCVPEPVVPEPVVPEPVIEPLCLQNFVYGEYNDQYSNSEEFALAELPDGLIAVHCDSRDNDICAFNFTTYNEEYRFTSEENMYMSIMVTSSGLLVAGTDTGRIIIWNTATQTILAEKQHSNEDVYKLLEMDGGRLISGSSDGSIFITGFTNPSSVTEFTFPAHDKVFDLAKLSNGNFASCGFDGTIKIWNPVNAQLITTLDNPNSVDKCSSILELKDGILAEGNGDGKIYIWNLSDEKIVNTTKLMNNYQVNEMVLLPNGNFVSANDYGIQTWNIETYEEIAEYFVDHTDEVFNLISLTDGSIISVSDAEMILWVDQNNC